MVLGGAVISCEPKAFRDKCNIRALFELLGSVIKTDFHSQRAEWRFFPLRRHPIILRIATSRNRAKIVALHFPTA